MKNYQCLSYSMVMPLIRENRLFIVAISKNNAKRASEWPLDIQNVTNRFNTMAYYFNGTENVFKESGLGLIPVLSYSIEF